MKTARVNTSRVLARIIGPVLIISAAGFSINVRVYQGMVQEFSKSASLCYFGGLIGLLFGLIILQFQNRWEARWPVIITILGWITVVKGALLILFPGLISHFLSASASGSVPMMISAAVSIAVGVFLSIKGYWE